MDNRDQLTVLILAEAFRVPLAEFQPVDPLESWAKGNGP